MDARFISVVEIGQHFMTKDTGEQFYVKACREHTLPRNDGSSQSKGWIQRTPKLDPFWKLRPVACVVNTELKSEFGLWVKATLNLGSEFLMDRINLWRIFNNNDTEVPEDQLEEYALQLKVKDCSQIKGNSKTTSIIEPRESSFSACEISKKVIHLLRHSQTVQREEDGAVQWWRGENIFRIIPHKCSIGLMNVGKLVWLQAEDPNEDISIALTIRE